MESNWGLLHCRQIIYQLSYQGSPGKENTGNYNTVCMHTQSLQSCPTLQPHGLYSLPGSSVHGIPQARILEWVAMPSLQGIFLTQGSNLCLLHCRQILYCWATGETSVVSAKRGKHRENGNNEKDQSPATQKLLLTRVDIMWTVTSPRNGENLSKSTGAWNNNDWIILICWLF